jgi:hypothetical protein
MCIHVNPQAVQDVCLLVVRLCSLGIIHTLVEVNMVSLLIRALPRNDDSLMFICYAIAALATFDDILVSQLTAAQPIRPLIAALEACTDNQRVTKTVVATLACLAHYPPLCEEIIREGGLAAIYKIKTVCLRLSVQIHQWNRHLCRYYLTLKRPGVPTNYLTSFTNDIRIHQD